MSQHAGASGFGSKHSPRYHSKRNYKMTKPMRTAAPAWEHPTGYELLRNPRLNKGTAFTEAERRPRVSKVCCRPP